MKEFLSNVFKSSGAGKIFSKPEEEKRSEWVREKQERNRIEEIQHRAHEIEEHYEDLIYGHPGHQEHHKEDKKRWPR